MAAAKFEQQCLALLDNVDPEGIVITKHGKPVARLVPFPQLMADLIGSMKDKIRVKKDIMTTGTVLRGRRDWRRIANAYWPTTTRSAFVMPWNGGYA